MTDSTRSIEALVSEIVLHLEADPSHDLEASIAAHPDHAAELRQRLIRLAELGLLPPAAGRRPRAEMFDPHRPAYSRGASLGGHVLGSEIGRGGMGRVLEAWDESLRRTVAWKTLSTGDTRAPLPTQHMERFLYEARVTAHLDHPGIVPVHALGTDDSGRPYYTMRLVRGETFERLITKVHARESPWDVRRALEILMRACDAVAYAHDRGVLHRDLKPSNLMVGNFGEVYVLDWGLAKQIGGVRTDTAAEQGISPGTSGSSCCSAELATAPGRALGTPAYMSPEQARGDLDALAPATDVYSLGAILYHLLTNCVPYAQPGRRETPSESVARVLAGPPAPVQLLAPSCAVELALVCERAMARSASERYSGVLEFREDLRAYLEHRRGRAWSDTPVRAIVKFARRRPLITLSVAAAVAILLALTGLGLEQSRRRLLEDNALAREESRTIPGHLQELLRAGYRFGRDQRAPDPAAWAAHALAVLARPEIDLSPLQPLPEFRERFDGLKQRNPAVGELLRLVLYRLQFWLFQARAAGHMDPLSSAQELQLAEAASRTSEILRGIEDDPWRRGVDAALIGFFGGAPGSLAALESSPPPRSAADLEWLGDAWLCAQRPDRANEAYLASLHLDPSRFHCHLQLALADSRGSEFEPLLDAWQHASQAVLLAPDSPWAWNCMGVLSASLASRVHSLPAPEWSAVLRRHPHLLTDVFLGVRAPAITDLENADVEGLRRAFVGAATDHTRSAYEHAIEFDPSYATPLSNLANTLQDDTRKQVLFERALQLDPNCVAALRSKAAWLASRSPQGLVEPWYDEEVDCRRTLLRLDPNAANYVEDLALVLHARADVRARAGATSLALEDRREACALLRTELTRRAGDWALTGRLAVIEWDAQQHEAALEHAWAVIDGRCSDMGLDPAGESPAQALRGTHELRAFLGARVPCDATHEPVLRARWCQFLAASRCLCEELERRLSAAGR